MLFNSWSFWLFFSIVLPLYWLLPHKAQNRMLLAASYLFYGWWDWRFLPLILFSTAMDFYLGLWVARASSPRTRRSCIAVSVTLNLLLLGIFKYYGFFSHELARLLSSLGLPASLPVLNVILPVGISFYTFQSMSYVIDIYRGVGIPSRSLLDFALYVAFFPHLVAGPIMRSGLRADEAGAAGLLKQIVVPRRFRDGDFQAGLYFITIGLFKKVVVGDNMAVVVNTIFRADPATLSGPECLAGIYAFAFQIYADFSGYSSIAQGLARWMGIDLMANFRMPYFAVSPSDFWRRWHISLSTWLRDYVYVSFGGSRGSSWLTYRNLMLTMLLGGLWHGANWTFLVWGAFHGALLCAYRWLDAPSRNKTLADFSPLHGAWRVFLMFHAVCLGWLLFRAESLSQVWTMLLAIATRPAFTPLALSSFALPLFYALPLIAFEFWLERRADLHALTAGPWLPRGLAYVYCSLMLLYFRAPVAHEFIYFQF